MPTPTPTAATDAILLAAVRAEHDSPDEAALPDATWLALAVDGISADPEERTPDDEIVLRCAAREAARSEIRAHLAEYDDEPVDDARLADVAADLLDAFDDEVASDDPLRVACLVLHPEG